MREKLEQLAMLAKECGIRELRFPAGAEGYAAVVEAGGAKHVTLYDDGHAIECADLVINGVTIYSQNYPARPLTNAEWKQVRAVGEMLMTYKRAVCVAT